MGGPFFVFGACDGNSTMWIILVQWIDGEDAGVGAKRGLWFVSK